MKTFCTSLRAYAKNINDFEQKNMLLFKEKLKSYQGANVCYVCIKKFLRKW